MKNRLSITKCKNNRLFARYQIYIFEMGQNMVYILQTEKSVCLKLGQIIILRLLSNLGGETESNL